MTEIERPYLDKLRAARIVTLSSYNDRGGVKYSWELSSRGRDLLKGNEGLSKLWQEKKIKELYEEFERQGKLASFSL